jgi:hypothetical protein
MPRRIALLGAFLALALAPLSALAADRIELSDGRVLVGTVKNMDQRVAVIETKSGTLRIAADSIRSVRVVEGEAEVAARKESARIAAELRKPGGRSAAATADKRRTGDPTSTDLALFATCRKLLASKNVAHRGDAMDLILSNWPATAAFLDSALRDSNAAVRVEATRLLAEDRIGEPVRRVRPRLRDTHVGVRMLAARVVRQRKLAQLELELAKLMRHDTSAAVRQEALRSLEEVGTIASAPALLELWEDTEEDRVKRRARQALVRIIGVDHADNAEAWTAAVQAATLAARAKAPVAPRNTVGKKAPTPSSADQR